MAEAKLDEAHFEEQMLSTTAAGLAISGVQPTVRTFFDSRMKPDPKPLDERVACLRGSIERLGKFAPGVPFITNVGAHPRGDMAEAMRVVSAKLRELAPVAADHGVTLALEPLNPTSVNVESAIWTIDQAMEVIEATDATRSACASTIGISGKMMMSKPLSAALATAFLLCRRAIGACRDRSRTESCPVAGLYRSTG